MRKALWLVACAFAAGLALDSLLWWGGVHFLEYRLASAHLSASASASASANFNSIAGVGASGQSNAGLRAGVRVGAGGGEVPVQFSGCSVMFQNKVRGGWPFRARLVLDGVHVTCGAASESAVLSYAVHHAALELAPWHPFTMLGILEGGQAFAVQRKKTTADDGEQGPLLVRAEGAPVRIFLPLQVERAGAAQFSTEFLHLVPQRGVGEAHPVTARGVSGRLVWNSQADAEASVLGLSFTAQRAVVAPWAESVENVRGALSIPGPAARLSAVWAQKNGTESDKAAESSDYAEILVQHLAGRWRDLGFSWSGRLVMAPGGLPVGETWLTLSDWRPFLARLQADKTLRSEQTVLLSRLTDRFEQRTGGMDGPLSVPLLVRDGAVQLAGVPLLSVLGTLHTVSVSGAGVP